MSAPARGGGLAYRARVVCVRCHERKVRCDLQDHPEGACRNCRREGVECRRRKGVRKRADPAKDPLASNIISFAPVSGNSVTSTSSAGSTPDPSRAILSTTSTQPRSGYIGDQSIISVPEDGEHRSSEARILALSNSTSETILQVTKATYGAPKTLSDAVIDFYFEHMWPIVPAVDRSDLEGPSPSLLLHNIVYFAGTLMRRTRDYPPLATPEDYYLKVKALLFVNHEKDKLNVVKTLCLLGYWNPSPPDLVSLDSPWQWTGMAIRLAQQLGLHNEDTYLRTRDPRVNRKLWWCLFNNEVMISTCYSRPSIINTGSYTVRLPEISDFPWPDDNALLFIHTTRVINIMKTCQELSSKVPRVEPEDILAVFASLQSWLEDLPPCLRLYTEQGKRKTYSRVALEIHVVYFLLIILLYLIPGAHRESRSVKIASIVASSCMARLYEDILLHEEANCLIPIHIWFCLVAAVPEIYCWVKFPALEKASNEELDTLSETLRALSEKYPHAMFFVNKINYFRNNAASVPGLMTAPNTRTSSPGPGSDEGRPKINPEELFSNIGTMFPFPEDLSPKLGLLAPQHTMDPPLIPTTLDDMAWSFDWSSISLDPAFSAFAPGQGTGFM